MHPESRSRARNLSHLASRSYPLMLPQLRRTVMTPMSTLLVRTTALGPFAKSTFRVNLVLRLAEGYAWQPISIRHPDDNQRPSCAAVLASFLCKQWNESLFRGRATLLNRYPFGRTVSLHSPTTPSSVGHLSRSNRPSVALQREIRPYKLSHLSRMIDREVVANV
jgi:hypothetical protein